jgi:hypothetical protein
MSGATSMQALSLTEGVRSIADHFIEKCDESEIKPPFDLWVVSCAEQQFAAHCGWKLRDHPQKEVAGKRGKTERNTVSKDCGSFGMRSLLCRISSKSSAFTGSAKFIGKSEGGPFCTTRSGTR